LNLILKKYWEEPGGGGAYLYPQHSGGRGRWISEFSEFEAILVYRVSSRMARDTQRNPVSTSRKKKKKKKKNGEIEMSVIVVAVLQICSHINSEDSVHMKQMHYISTTP
jgi:hypothetical protein